MVTICSFEKVGSYGFVFTYCTFCHVKKTLPLYRDFHSTAMCYFGYLHSHLMQLCIWESHPLLYFIFVQHWTCDSGFFCYYVYFSLHGTVDTVTCLKIDIFSWCICTWPRYFKWTRFAQKKTFFICTDLLHIRQNTPEEHLRFQCR